MITINAYVDKLFKINSFDDFEELALFAFYYQYNNNPIYQEYCNYIKGDWKNVNQVSQIPFLPIQFFKSHKIRSHYSKEENLVFYSSGTGSIENRSKHYIVDENLYIDSILKSFGKFIGNPATFSFINLLPNYMENKNSSLIYMVNELVKHSSYEPYYSLKANQELIDRILENEENQIPTIIFGVTFALIELVEKYQLKLNYTIVIETGGMKGRGKEMIREELHELLKSRLGINHVYSEYSMTELLSQAYYTKNNYFECPSWMKVMIRDTNDPFSIYTQYGKNGGINIIDLANIYSCSFIATQDLGVSYSDSTFNVLGRFDHSDIRGCNLLALS